ncbi:MAG: hypothetical protein HY271_12095 [Deltaproteobacteria bacterium]|nr:hypothetical protein [Deltaproteobacteria bacterium]
MSKYPAILFGVALFALGYACGGGGGASLATPTLFELNGGSLARQLEEAGPPAITAGFGIAERAPEDGTRHFTLTVATENRESREDTAALYAQMDGHGAIGGIWGGNLLAYAHSDMESGIVQGLEVDVGNLGANVPVTGINVIAIGPRPSDVALGILNGDAAGAGGFREGIAFRSSGSGVAVTEALMRVQPGFGTVATGIDLREARFTGPATATPGFTVDAQGAVTSAPLATGGPAFACLDPAGRLFASHTPCVAS